MPMSRRLQVLVDDVRWARLEAEAARRGTSVARVVRDAIDAALVENADVRRDAAATLLAAPPMPVADWADMKAELAEAGT